MSLTVGMVTLDTTDPMPLARWWAEQLGGNIIQENDGFFPVVSLGEGGPLLAFQKVDDPTPGKNKMHLDLTADNVDAEVARLVAAGATRIAERQMPGFAWVTLADPDGNEFCVAEKHEA
ncbi:VOC family protein [Gordonia aurantiaca]|uniref:VOC family protein n=1 Tax=Gordonia sp. B21 TaxID=3151852 RepID=UPI00326374DF